MTDLLWYDFDIIYKARIDSKAADGLTRILWQEDQNSSHLLGAITVTSTLKMHDIIHEIDQNQELQGLIQKVIEGTAMKQRFTIISGRLFYQRRLVIPCSSSLIPMILKEYHDTLLVAI